MPTIRVELFAGRTLEQKRALAQALTEATVRTLGGSADAVDVIFCDVRASRLGHGRPALGRQGGGAEAGVAAATICSGHRGLVTAPRAARRGHERRSE